VIWRQLSLENLWITVLGGALFDMLKTDSSATHIFDLLKKELTVLRTFDSLSRACIAVERSVGMFEQIPFRYAA
jgi:hypothetical protein